MNWLEATMWGVSAVSFAATVANIKKRRWCFYAWAVTNALWTAYDIYKHAYPQAGLMAAYFLLALWGIWEWRAKP